MEKNRFPDGPEIQRGMLDAAGNEYDGCRGDGVLLHFLSHPEIYLRIETTAKIRQFRTEENKEFIIFVDVRSFPANRRGENLPSYGGGCSGQRGSASKVSLGRITSYNVCYTKLLR